MKKLTIVAKAGGQEHTTTQTVPQGADYAAVLMAVSSMLNTLQAAQPQLAFEELHVAVEQAA
ncbi:hypothetical protein [Bradyrhizobium japonicum]|uniref:hypothetical protein n=1 Tax=Bradyrhizobium japonicum TaxID=375 RepID=UPI000418212B|nr:hypothetical protein [Bradyrhizobium japonicum]